MFASRAPKSNSPRASSPILLFDANKQHAMPKFRCERCSFEVGWQLDRPFEMTVGDFHAIMATTFSNAAIAAHAMQPQTRPIAPQTDIFAPHAHQLDLDQPTVAGATNIDKRPP